MTDDLDQKTDAELTMTFAKEVTDLLMPEYWETKDHPFVCREDARGARMLTFPHFATDVNAVLPWLEKSRHFPLIMRPHHGEAMERAYEVLFHGIDQKSYAPTLARALVLALIRAARSAL